MDLGVGSYFAPDLTPTWLPAVSLAWLVPIRLHPELAATVATDPEGQPGHRRCGDTSPNDGGHGELLPEVMLKDRCPTRGEEVELVREPPAGDHGNADEKPRPSQSCHYVWGRTRRSTQGTVLSRAVCQAARLSRQRAHPTSHAPQTVSKATMPTPTAIQVTVWAASRTRARNRPSTVTSPSDWGSASTSPTPAHHGSSVMEITERCVRLTNGEYGLGSSRRRPRCEDGSAVTMRA